MRALLTPVPLAFAIKLAGMWAAGALALAGERFIGTVPDWHIWFAGFIALDTAVRALNVLVAFAVV